MYPLLRVSAAVIVITSIALSGPAVAQTRSASSVSKGAVLREVLASWGEPDERIVRGVKRELVWRYKGGAYVVFKEGKVSSFKSGVAEQVEQAKKAAKIASVKKAETAAEQEQKHILRDILDEIPGGPDGPAPGGPPMPPSDPNLAGLIPNAIPQRNGPPPGIAPGVVIPSMDEEADQMAE